jgi:hypothetical protein
MTEEQKVTGAEELRICSVNDLQKSCEKHPRLLLVSMKKEREAFLQKFVNEAVPKDTSVVAVETGGSCETLEKLGMKDACKAVFFEKGRIKREISLQDDDLKDTIALTRMIYEKEDPPECESCKAEILIDKKGWKLKPEHTEQCSRTLSNLGELRPDVRKYFEKHMKKE